MNVWALRRLVLNLCLVIFGYVFPSLSSAKAILSKDDEALREWLTYWAVFSIFTFGESIFDLLIWRLPFYRELKIGCVLWLSLPGSQGAYRVYNYVIRPYFEHYEEDIDSMVDKVSNRIKKKASTHIQNIAWQLLLSPKDGLLPEFMRLFGFFKKFVTDEEHVRQDEDSKVMSSQLLKDFKLMLLDGVHIEASMRETEGSFCVVKISLLEERGHSLILESVDQAFPAIKLSLFKISCVTPTEADPNIILIENDREDGLLLRATDLMESDAVIAGLQIMLMNNRAMHTRILKKAFSISIAHIRFENIKIAFERLKEMPGS